MRPALLAVAMVVLVACSSGPDEPEPFAISEEAELTTLDVGSDEPIAEEGDEVETEEYDADEALADAPLPADAVENPVDEDPESPEELATEGEDAKEPDPIAAAATTTTTTTSYRFLDIPIPKGEKRATVAAGKWRCKRKTSRRCICQGSPMNCEFPSDQPARNRFLPPAEVGRIKAAGVDALEKIGRWEVAENTPLYDGAGHLRYPKFSGGCHDWAGPTGSKTKDVAGTCAKLNFGQKKTMKVDGDTAAHTYVYAFAVSVPDGNDADDKRDGASSWIPLSSVKKRATVSKMPNIKAPRLTNFVETSYVLKSAEDWGQAAGTFRAEKLPAWSRAKVAKGGGSRKATGDYLLRDGNVLNLCYSTPGLGGVATDTVLVGPSTVAFRRVKSTAAKPTLVRVPVYNSKEKKGMYFAYGSIAGRFGWVALASLKKGKVKEGPAAAPVLPEATCNGLPDGFHCDGAAPARGLICANGAPRKTFTCATSGERCLGTNADGTDIVCGP